ncbi:unnamed protein product, partial [Allacma fusca]
TDKKQVTSETLSSLDTEEESDDLDSEEEPTRSNGARNVSIYDRLKKAIGKIRKSSILRDSMDHFCETFKIPKLQLLQDMKVRRNSTLKMLQRCLTLRQLS